jgi:hypothetical protein
MKRSHPVTVFVPDTNVWVSVGRDLALTAKFEKALGAGDEFLIAPPALIELVRGLVRHGNETFHEDKKTYQWMRDRKCKILELTKPFMAEILRTTLPTRSGVIPQHYEQLIEMIVSSSALDEFVQRCHAADSVWKSVEALDQIHEGQIEKELRALEQLASQDWGLGLAEALSKMFGVPGCRPKPLVVDQHFSAAIEYLETSVRKVVRGAKPRKNDRGMYVDWQLLMYLAIPNARFLTNENFSGEITKSPQRERIVEPDTLV